MSGHTERRQCAVGGVELEITDGSVHRAFVTGGREREAREQGQQQNFLHGSAFGCREKVNHAPRRNAILATQRRAARLLRYLQDGSSNRTSGEWIANT